MGQTFYADCEALAKVFFGKDYPKETQIVIGNKRQRLFVAHSAMWTDKERNHVQKEDARELTVDSRLTSIGRSRSKKNPGD